MFRNLIVVFIFVVLSGCALNDYVSSATKYSYDIGNSKGHVDVGVVDGICTIDIEDEITPSLVNAFMLALVDLESRICSEKWVLLSSLGGDVKSAADIGYIVREKKLNTSLVNGMYLEDFEGCYSACALIFIAGIERGVNGTIYGSPLGFHRLSRIESDGSKTCLPPDMQEYKAVNSYVSAMLPAEGASRFLELMASADCEDMKRYHFDELVESGIVTTRKGSGIRLF